MDSPEKKLAHFICTMLCWIQDLQRLQTKSLRNACPNRQSLGSPQRAYTLDSSLRNCSQHPPVTAIPRTSSPSPCWYQTAASPSKGKNRGRGRQKKARGESTGEGSERTRKLRVVTPMPASPGTRNTSPHFPIPKSRPSPVGGQTPATAPPSVSQPHPVPASPRRGDGPVPPAAAPFWLLSPSRPQRRRVTGPGGGDRKRTPAGRPGLPVQPLTDALQQAQGCRPNVPDGQGDSVQARSFSVAHAGRGWHLLRRLWISSEWLAPPDFQAIAKHTRSRYRTTFSAATVPSNFPKSETTSHTVTAPLVSPLERPLLLPSLPLPLPPLRAPGIPRGTHALCDAAQPGVRPGGRGGRRGRPVDGVVGGWQPALGDCGEVGRVNAAGVSLLRLAPASLLRSAGRRAARWDSFLAAAPADPARRRDGGTASPTCASASGSAVSALSAVASGGSAPMSVQIAR